MTHHVAALNSAATYEIGAGDVAAALEKTGLPAGPLGELVEFHLATSGKTLHAYRYCKRNLATKRLRLTEIPPTVRPCKRCAVPLRWCLPDPMPFWFDVVTKATGVEHALAGLETDLGRLGAAERLRIADTLRDNPLAAARAAVADARRDPDMDAVTLAAADEWLWRTDRRIDVLLEQLTAVTTAGLDDARLDGIARDLAGRTVDRWLRKQFGIDAVSGKVRMLVQTYRAGGNVERELERIVANPPREFSRGDLPGPVLAPDPGDLFDWFVAEWTRRVRVAATVVRAELDRVHDEVRARTEPVPVIVGVSYRSVEFHDGHVAALAAYGGKRSADGKVWTATVPTFVADWIASVDADVVIVDGTDTLVTALALWDSGTVTGPGGVRQLANLAQALA